MHLCATKMQTSIKPKEISILFIPDVQHHHKILLTLDPIFGGTFCTITPMVTQSPSMLLSLFNLVGILCTLTILRFSIL